MAVDQIIWMALTTWSLWALNLCAESCHVSSQPLCWILPCELSTIVLNPAMWALNHCAESCHWASPWRRQIDSKMTLLQSAQTPVLCPNVPLRASACRRQLDSKMTLLQSAQTPVLCPDVPQRASSCRRQIATWLYLVRRPQFYVQMFPKEQKIDSKMTLPHSAQIQVYIKRFPKEISPRFVVNGSW